ncbi:competence protein ComEC [Agromyces flavus]|uniref:Competence protein ComEC n=1 Tax=Agromyces flavus TaxID=589382 RepID=A0A1H1S5K9_9MICO|nr:competence protein ComEC [Agromyces flavus]GGI48405.1 competence protein ComEC [Agromyces flavus]SDS43026.1 competence protein ComEC [Agromyces flavus]
MRGHDLRLICPAVAAWAAAWLATGATDVAAPVWLVPAACWALAAAALVILVAGVRGTRRGRRGAMSPRPRRSSWVILGAPVLVAMACAGLSATTAATALSARQSSPLLEAAATRQPIELTVRLDSSPRPETGSPWGGEGSQRARATLLAVDGRDAPALALDVSIPDVDAPSPRVGFGSRLELAGRVGELPGSERAAFRFRASEIVVVGPAPPLVAWTHPLRAGLADGAERLGGDGGALVPGLAIGDTSRLRSDLEEAMAGASLTHLTAVSGANCALVTALAFWAAGAMRLRRSIRVIVALVALGGFVVLVTPESSVVRAAAMAVVVLVACATGRTGGGVPALGLATIVLLVVDPWYSRDFGFALSVCATAGLVLGSGPLAALLGRWMPRTFALVLAVPLAAQLACQPVLVLLEPVVPVYGVPANLLAAPAAPIATMAGLVGCLLLPVLPSAGFAALQVAWLPASWIALLARGVESMPFQAVPWLPDAGGAVLCAASIGAGVVLAVRSRPGRIPRAVRVAAAITLCLSLAVPVGVAAGRPVLVHATLPADWDVLQCDVGQGDAVLVRDGGAVLLIDTGPDPARLAGCLSLTGVDRLDLAIITHWDADHAGGAEAIAGRVDVVLHGPLDGRRSDRALDPLARGGAELVQVGAGATGRLGDARWRVLWPPARADPGNDASVVLDLIADGYRAVFLGDLGAEAQAALLREHDLGRADVVKVAHHGSADQDPALYRELAASVGFIGVGAANGYGHPTPSLLGLLAEVGTVPVRSDRSGAGALVVDGGRFALWSERGDPSAVSPDAQERIGVTHQPERRPWGQMTARGRSDRAVAFPRRSPGGGSATVVQVSASTIRSPPAALASYIARSAARMRCSALRPLEGGAHATPMLAFSREWVDATSSSP